MLWEEVSTGYSGTQGYKEGSGCLHLQPVEVEEAVIRGGETGTAS